MRHPMNTRPSTVRRAALLGAALAALSLPALGQATAGSGTDPATSPTAGTPPATATEGQGVGNPAIGAMNGRAGAVDGQPQLNIPPDAKASVSEAPEGNTTTYEYPPTRSASTERGGDAPAAGQQGSSNTTGAVPQESLPGSRLGTAAGKSVQQDSTLSGSNSGSGSSAAPTGTLPDNSLAGQRQGAMGGAGEVRQGGSNQDVQGPPQGRTTQGGGGSPDRSANAGAAGPSDTTGSSNTTGAVPQNSLPGQRQGTATGQATQQGNDMAGSNSGNAAAPTGTLPQNSLAGQRQGVVGGTGEVRQGDSNENVQGPPEGRTTQGGQEKKGSGQ